MKLAIGCLLNGLAYLVMVVAAWSADGGKASWLWLLAFFVVITIGELYLSPTSLSLVTKIAPASLLSMMMGVWLSTSFVGGFPRRLSRHVLVEHGKNQFFPDARAHFSRGSAIALLRHPLRSVLQD